MNTRINSLALALAAGACGPALAQSNVSISGYLDIGVYRDTASKWTVGSIQGNNGTADYGRLNNGIFYDSPTLSGFGVHLSTSPELRTGDLNRPVGVSLTYNQSPFAAMLAHEKNSAGNTDTFVGLKGTLSGV